MSQFLSEDSVIMASCYLDIQDHLNYFRTACRETEIGPGTRFRSQLSQNGDRKISDYSYH